MESHKYSIKIDAPVEKVWNKMLQHGGYEEWTSVSWPNSFYEGRWIEGEHIRFISTDGSGTLAYVKKAEQFSSIRLVHVAVLLAGGVEHRDSEEAKGWIGTQENYDFISQDDATTLNIEMVTPPAWAKMFDEGWPPALEKLKQICEGV
jgi:hypothetical protein